MIKHLRSGVGPGVGSLIGVTGRFLRQYLITIQAIIMPARTKSAKLPETRYRFLTAI